VPLPRLTDDGRTVTLDLHGLRVADAEAAAHRTVALAAAHGRHAVRLIHGHSTTGPHGARTIKTALHEHLDARGFAPHVVSALRNEGDLLLGLPPAARPAPGRLRLSDLL
jgi:DNA-nicking Smr family endonuclease